MKKIDNVWIPIIGIFVGVENVIDYWDEGRLLMFFGSAVYQAAWILLMLLPILN